jgi:integrase
VVSSVCEIPWIEAPHDHGEAEVEAFLNHLAINRGVAPGTQNQAFSALIFLYGRVLGVELKGIDAKRAKARKTLPVVLSVEEVKAIMAAVPEGTPRTLLSLLYGCGLRVNEVLRLRVKDLDFENGLVWVRNGKGGKDPGSGDAEEAEGGAAASGGEVADSVSPASRPRPSFSSSSSISVRCGVRWGGRGF